jgi:hypothetical protein
MERLIIAAVLCAGGGGLYVVADSHHQSVRTPAIAPYGTSPLVSGGGAVDGLSQSPRLPSYGTGSSSPYGATSSGLDSGWPSSSLSDLQSSTGPTSYSEIGGSIYGSDGTSCNSIGSSTYCSGRGGSTSYSEIGGSIYGSDGTSCNSIGSSTYCSGPGGSTSYTQIGGSIYGSDGSSCTSIGSSTYCSGGR